MNKRTSKILSIILSLVLLFQQSGFAQIAAELNIAGHLSAFRNSFVADKFRPIHLRYLQYLPETSSFKLFLDKGDQFSTSRGHFPSKLLGDSSKESVPWDNTKLQSETKTLINYFYIGLALPNNSFWVNLRPDAEDNIIDEYLSKTDIGKIMLETDLQLKKDTANFTSPQTPEGKAYWDKLYKKAAELYGYDNVTIPTLTRPWIVPGEIIVRESQDSAYIYKATLKVMLEQDYLKNSATYNFQDERSKALNEYSSELIRELIIPKLTKEINSSKRYAPLRQVYYSLILAQWFKARHKQPLIDSRDLTNLISKVPWSKTTYFQAYQKSFKEGEYKNQEPVYTPTGQVIRSYFSGGENFNNIASSSMVVIPVSQSVPLAARNLIEASSNVSSPIADYDNIIQELEPKGILTNRQANILQKLILSELWERRTRVMMAGLDEFVYPAGSVAFNLDSGKEQLKLIKQDFAGLIKEKSLRGDYKFTIYQVGLAKTAGETKAIIQAFKEAFQDAIDTVDSQDRDKWTLEIKGVDINKEALGNANLLKNESEYSTGPIKINMVFIPANVLNRKALEELAGSDKADYIFYRYVGYSNKLVNSGWLNLKNLQESDIQNWPDMLNSYLSLRNISLAFGKPGSRIVVEPVETNEFNFYKRALNLPGASLLLPDNPRSGIYKIDDLKAFPKLGFAGFLQMQPLSLNVSSALAADPAAGLAASSNLIKLRDKIEGLGGKIETVKLRIFKDYSLDYHNKIIELDLNDFFKKSQELERYQELRKEILLFTNALLSNVGVADRGNMLFAIKESIQNAFIHGNKANPNYPIFIRLNINKNNQLLSAEIYSALLDESDAKALEKARKANLFGAGEGEKGIKEVVEFKREELKDEAGSVIGTKVTLVPFGIQKESIRGALSMKKQSAVSPLGADPAAASSDRQEEVVVSSEVLNPVSLSEEVRLFQEDLVASGIATERESREMVKFLQTKSKGVMTVYDFLTKFRNNKDGYALGISSISAEKIYKALSLAANLMTWQDGYSKFNLFLHEKERFLQIITSENKPIVFFVPRKIFTFSDGRTTRSEMRWFLNHPDNMKNVYFVFGAYENVAEVDGSIKDVGSKKASSALGADPAAGSPVKDTESASVAMGKENAVSYNGVYYHGTSSKIISILRSGVLLGPRMFVGSFSDAQEHDFGSVGVILGLNNKILQDFGGLQYPAGTKGQIIFDKIPFTSEYITELMFRSKKVQDAFIMKLMELDLDIPEGIKLRISADNKDKELNNSSGSETVDKKSGVDTLTSSPLIFRETKAPGGIDFRNLPIVAQAMSNLRMSSITGDTFRKSYIEAMKRKVSPSLEKEWQDIEQMVNSGITPSADRIKEYLQASCAKGNILGDKDKAILCIADILRSEEEECRVTDPALRDILVVLETSGSSAELSRIFLG